jgi:opacity protein-like surface antigen
MRKTVYATLLVTLIAAPARAQDERQVHFTIGGGLSKPLGEVADRFNTGGAFTIGMTFEPDAPVGLQVEYGFNGTDGPDTRIPLMRTATAAVTDTALIESRARTHYFVANAMLRTTGVGRFQPYAVGGGGIYNRSVSLTTPDVGFTTYCDPYWYACFPTPVEVDRVIGDRSSWDPGINMGGGLAIRLGEEASFYVESRWHYTWGPTFTDQNGEDHRANGRFLPVTFGFKF